MNESEAENLRNVLCKSLDAQFERLYEINREIEKLKEELSEQECEKVKTEFF